MMVSRRGLLAASASLLLARVGQAEEPVDGLLARIARARAAVNTLQGPFTQTRTIGLLATDVVSRGTLTLVRPDRLRWELGPPDSVTFWVGPEGLAYRSAHGQGKVAGHGARIAAALDDLRTLLGGDLSRLRERWSLRVVRDDAGGAELEATVRDTAPAGIRAIRFTLAPDLVRPTRALLIEGTRDRTAIEFGDARVNVPVDGAAMRPPA